MTSTKIKSYSELIKIPDIKSRFEYLRTGSRIGDETFGYDRYLNQMFYNIRNNPFWRETRNYVIVRDYGLDLGLGEIPKGILVVVHHINPITKDDILNNSELLYDPDNLITSADDTHKVIHYGGLLPQRYIDMIERSKYDTCPWRRNA